MVTYQIDVNWVKVKNFHKKMVNSIFVMFTDGVKGVNYEADSA